MHLCYRQRQRSILVIQCRTILNWWELGITSSRKRAVEKRWLNSPSLIFPLKFSRESYWDVVIRLSMWDEWFSGKIRMVGWTGKSRPPKKIIIITNHFCFGKKTTIIRTKEDSLGEMGKYSLLHGKLIICRSLKTPTAWSSNSEIIGLGKIIVFLLTGHSLRFEAKN